MRKHQEHSNTLRKFAGKREVGWLLAAVVILWLVNFFFSMEKTGDIIATVYYQSEEYTKINLTRADDGETIKIAGDLPVTLQVQNHAVAFVSAQCPDKICEHSGYIDSPGQQAICLPAKVGILIHNGNGEKYSDADMIAK